MPGLGRPVPGGVGGVSFPGVGSVSKFASSPSLRELGFPFLPAGLGGDSWTTNSLGTRDRLLKHNKGTGTLRRGRAARGTGLGADRKELINPALMIPAPSPVGSVLRAPVIDKYRRGRMGVRRGQACAQLRSSRAGRENAATVGGFLPRGSGDTNLRA